ADDAGLAGGIDRFTGGADPSRIGRDIDDPAPFRLYHHWRNLVGKPDRAAQIDGNDLVPERRVGLKKAEDAVPADVVDKHGYRTEMRCRRLQGRIAGCIIGNIRVDGNDRLSGNARTDFLRRLLCRLFIDIENCNIVAGGCELQSDCRPDSPCSARYDRQSWHAPSLFLLAYLCKYIVIYFNARYYFESVIMIASSDAEDITGGEWRKEKGGGGVIHRFAPIETGTNSGPRHRPPRAQRYMRLRSEEHTSEL